MLSIILLTIFFHENFAGKCPSHEYSTPFNSSSSILTKQLNSFWSIYGNCEEKLDTTDNCFGDNPAWAEWDSLKFSWNDRNSYRDHGKTTLFRFPIIGINGTEGEMSDGFLWSWIDSERWPDARGSHGHVASYHFDQLPRFTAAIYQYYVWTGDRIFLQSILPRAELVVNFLISNMNGSAGIPINTINDGISENSRPSTYMDQVKSGWKDAWIALTFYTALNNIAALESVVGNETNREFYQSLADKLNSAFDDIFWNETTGRYAGWVDRNGNQHDSGYVYINLEAIARGLGNRSKADRIFDWLSHPADPILIGPHNGSTDVYHNIVAPRTTTENVRQSDWDGWSDPDEGRRPYGGLVESGGTMMWLTYYDVMARLRFNYTDEAFNILNNMLERVDNDSNCLTFNYEKGRIRDDFGEDFVQIGSNFPFPESGIAAISFLHGFVGVTAQIDGLKICPQLPSSLDFIQAQVNYIGVTLTIRILEKGELQVSDKERTQHLENTFKEIASVVSGKCINPETKRPYTISIIEQAMRDIHFSINPNRNAKQQALDVIRQLKHSNNIPIQQAQMRVQLTIPAKDAKKFKEKMNKLSAAPNIENEEFLGSSMQLICSIDPGVFRELDDLLRSETRGQGQLELLSLMDVAEGDEALNDLNEEKTDD
ncbi:unnamed protein product [Rotaria magnacalcarata]|uniref:Uncharacterized protein n=1 Tax=Rotaria magnacalcarata TaxID=392030 RepID=A0A8S2J3Z3_9BILA|nr:unnamed protein product [Rotaria magnacalcarata]CAF3812266.1 unnamed protein product [Rotaria magnacalcarata]